MKRELGCAWVEVVDYCGNTKTATCEVTVKSAEPEPVVPGSDPIDVPTGKTQQQFMDDINTNATYKANYLKAPGDPENTTAMYLACFSAVPAGDGKIDFELNETGTNTLTTSANALVAVTANLGDSTESKVTITPAVKDVVAGFYYGLAASADVSTIGAATPATWKLATTAGIEGGLSADKPAESTKGFFEVKVSATNPAAE